MENKMKEFPVVFVVEKHLYPFGTDINSTEFEVTFPGVKMVTPANNEEDFFLPKPTSITNGCPDTLKVLYLKYKSNPYVPSCSDLSLFFV